MVQVPAPTRLSVVVDVTVHTAVLDDEYVTAPIPDPPIVESVAVPFGLLKVKV